MCVHTKYSTAKMKWLALVTLVSVPLKALKRKVRQKESTASNLTLPLLPSRED